MSGFLSEDEAVPCKVVMNVEDQYSLWPVDQAPPAGWREEGFRGSRRECLAYIDNAWQDMRPRSLRELKQ